MRITAIFLQVVRQALLSLATLGVLWASAAEELLGQTPATDRDAEGEVDEGRVQRLDEMRQRAAAFKAFAHADGTKELVLAVAPVLRFSDPVRTASDGTIWVWCDKDLPVALVTIERYDTFWSYELVSMTTNQLKVLRPDGAAWRPTEAGIEFRPLRDVPPPAESKASRLRQMRDLARQFALSETYRESTSELRLLPNPAYRYSDVDTGTLDGALFVYAYGTNPEAVLAMEARRPADGAARWHFGFVRLSAAELNAKLGRETVWTERQELQTADDAPYTHFRLSRASN